MFFRYAVDFVIGYSEYIKRALYIRMNRASLKRKLHSCYNVSV
ncbi:hypothetical protein FM106_21895 [Brachybacterium faecium]|nr:hypothetical protein FM106_21895 [Brachybacterium faecium]